MTANPAAQQIPDTDPGRIVERYLVASGATGLAPDLAEVDRIVADDVEWRLAGEGLDYARVYRGKEDLARFFLEPLAALIDGPASTIETTGLFVDREQGAVTLQRSEHLVTRSGAEIDVDVVVLFRIHDGRIAAATEYMDLRPLAAVMGTSFPTAADATRSEE